MWEYEYMFKVGVKGIYLFINFWQKQQTFIWKMISPTLGNHLCVHLARYKIAPLAPICQPIFSYFVLVDILLSCDVLEKWFCVKCIDRPQDPNSPLSDVNEYLSLACVMRGAFMHEHFHFLTSAMAANARGLLQLDQTNLFFDKLVATNATNR